MVFNKILIANRGEIAIRVIRTCKELGVPSLAVYDEDDANSLFYRLADEAALLQGSGAVETYLNIGRIIDTARNNGCDAIHPGYGFLSENAEFVAACEDAGIKFIGPTSQTMARVGDKAAVKETLKQGGVPSLPSIIFEGDMDALKTAARDMGYPVIIKPTFGGGGKGMKIVREEAEMDDAVRQAQNIGRAAFGSDAFYVEKYLEHPRHIEVQIIADKNGEIIDLGERECSIQRRHQKLIEESPSAVLTESQRDRATELARLAARLVGYENAGTVEFLYQDGSFYFMEINARIQVEHPVTELVTGLDLIKKQILIAGGDTVGGIRREGAPLGHAVECRINAEDPRNNFMPCPGRILGYRSPGGIGIRVDSGVFMNFEIPPQYDSLVSKLSAWGRDRCEAMSRMRRALDEYIIVGIKTTLPIYRAIFREPDFLRGDYDTLYLEKHKDALAALLEQHGSSAHSELKQAVFPQPVEEPETKLPVCDAYVVDERDLP